ncbi:MAG: OsmC family protein [Anaerolineales bacterium]
MQANVMWTEELRFVGNGDGSATVAVIGGDIGEERVDGFSPLNLLLVGLAGCTAADVISILQKKRQSVTHFEVHATASQATDHPHVFTHIHIEYIIEGHGIEQSAVERSIELSETKYCPAIAMLGEVVPIEHSFEIKEASL